MARTNTVKIKIDSYHSIRIPVKITELLGVQPGEMLSLSYDGEAFILTPIES